MEFCNDCRRVTEGETIFALTTDSLTAFEDGEYEMICPFCKEAAVVDINEDNPDFDR